jgi:hypothetical protein
VGSADPMTPVGVRPRRPRLLLGGAIIMLLVIIAIVVLLANEPEPNTGTAEPSAEELQRLSAEAAAAAVNLFKKQDEADAAGDTSVLDGLYVPGSQLEVVQKDFIRNRAAAGEISEPRTETSGVEVERVDRGQATVLITHEVIEVKVRDIKTRKLKRTEVGVGPTGYRIGFRRLDNRWLVNEIQFAKEDG